MSSKTKIIILIVVVIIVLTSILSVYSWLEKKRQSKDRTRITKFTLKK